MAAFEEGEVFPVADSDTELSTGLVFGGGEVISIMLGVFFIIILSRRVISVTIRLYHFTTFTLLLFQPKVTRALRVSRVSWKFLRVTRCLRYYA